MAQTLKEFALDLRTYMHKRMDHWWPLDPGSGDGRRRMTRLNQGALSDVTRIDRNRLSRILSGKEAPEAHQLAALLKAAGAEEYERAEWETRRLGASSSRPDDVATTPLSGPDPTSDDFEIDGLFMVNTWGGSAPLTSEHAIIRQTDEVEPDHLPPSLVHVWESIQDRVPAGSICVVSGVGDPDWQETADQTDYQIDVRRAPYSLALAQRELFTIPDVRRRAEDLLREYDLIGFVSEFPACMVAVNVQVATDDGYLVALRRSRLVHNYKSQWALSINETMKAAPDGADQEGLFDLAYRGMDEELNLRAEHVENVSVEWFGACLDCGDFYVFANARVRPKRDELSLLRSRAHSRREHDNMVFLDAEQLASTDFRGPGPDGSRWLHHAALAAHLGFEMLR